MKPSQPRSSAAWRAQVQATIDAFKPADQDARTRAIKRCGDLLREIESQSRHNAEKKRSVGDDTSFSRTQAAADAGLSKDQGARTDLQHSTGNDTKLSRTQAAADAGEASKRQQKHDANET